MEKYKPSNEEIAKAEGMMTDEQKGMSEQRKKEFKEYRSISKEDVKEIIKKILLKSDFTNKEDVEVLYELISEHIAQENINPDDESGKKAIENLALDILSKRESIKKEQPDTAVAIEKDSVVGIGETDKDALRDALRHKGKNI